MNAQQGSPEGTWCFSLGEGIDANSVSVVASAINPGRLATDHHGIVLEEAKWMTYAPDCPSGNIEIRTFGYEIEEEKLVAVPDGEVSYSFIVP